MHDSERSTPVMPEPHDAETTLKDEHVGELNDDLRSPISKTGSYGSSPVSPNINKTSFNTDDLLNEIRQLKAEAKIKDERIKQLEHQLATRCNCRKEPQQIQLPRDALRTHCDKFTQTPWRKVSGGYSAPSPWQGSYQGIPRTGPQHRRQRLLQGFIWCWTSFLQPQVLQHPICIPSAADQFQGTLTRTSPFEDLSENHSESYSEALEKEANELSELFCTQMEIEDFDSDGQAEECFLTNDLFPISKHQAWSEAEQPQMCPSFVEVSRIEKEKTVSLKKPSLSNLCPKTLPLFISKKVSTTSSPEEEASSEVTTSQSKACIQSQLPTAHDLLTESPSICDILSEVQLSSASSLPVLPHDVVAQDVVNHLQPSNIGLLQLHVSVTNPSQLHLTVASPSQQCLANSGLSHMSVNCLPASQSPLEDCSLQSRPEDHTSLLPLSGDAPPLLYTESDNSSDALAMLNVLIQPSLIDNDLLHGEVAARTEQQAQVQTISVTKFSITTPSIRSSTTSQKTLKLPAGNSKILKPASAYSAKTVPVNSITGKTSTAMLNSTAASPLSTMSSAPSSAGVLSQAGPTLKSPSANLALGKLAVAKTSVKKLSSASASAQRLRITSPSKKQSPQASPSKQKPPEVTLFKPPSANLSLLDPSMVHSEMSAVKQTVKYSKLRPPSVVIKPKQTDSPERSSTLMHQDHQKSLVKGTSSNIPRMVTQKKDLHAGDGMNPSRLSRLPKPKT